MTNHLDILSEGVEHWNQWRVDYPNIEPDLSGIVIRATRLGTDLQNINLSNTNLSEANLEDVNLQAANFQSANLRYANLCNANLRNANFQYANLHNAELRNADLSEANLSSTDLRFADLKNVKLRLANLSDANLNDADLNYASLKGVSISDKTRIHRKWKLIWKLVNQGYSTTDDLSNADLGNADLSGVDFSEANLVGVHALGTDFTRVTFTGACLQDWHINAQTILDDVICDFFYLKKGQQERRPSDPENRYNSGDFTKYFQKALNTVDLIFADGLDWKAFFQSFQELRQQYADKDLSIQAIEKKSGGSFVIRLEVPTEVSKAEIERAAKEKYEIARQALEFEYKVQLEFQGRRLSDFQEQVKALREGNTELLGIVKTMAETPTYDLSNATFGGGFAAEGGTQIGGTYNDISKLIQGMLSKLWQKIKNRHTT